MQTPKKSHVFLTVLSCLVIGNSPLFSATNELFVEVDTQAATASCADSSCATSSNTCCQFLDALTYAQSLSDPSIINLASSTITYTGSPSYCINQTAVTLISSDQTDGTVIDFNEQFSSGGAIFQPTYASSSLPGEVSLSNVVFQNGPVINIAGGSLTFYGTQTTGGEVFSNNSWTAGLYDGNQPGFIFAENTTFADAYNEPFPGNITYNANNTSFYLTNNSGVQIEIQGDISNSTYTGAELEITSNTSDVGFNFTGSITMENIELLSGKSRFKGSSNSINEFNIESGSIAAVGANLGDATFINMNGGELAFINFFGESNVFGTGNTITFNSSDGAIDDTGYVVNIGATIEGSDNLVKLGNGAVILTEDSTSFTGKIYVEEGILVINADFSSSSDPIVQSGALLAGTGNIGSTTVNGTLKGGHPLGTLTVTGDLDFSSGSQFATLIGATTNSLVDVTGNVTIGDNTNLLLGVSPSQFANDVSAVILSGNLITGQFSEVLGRSLYFFTSSLDYTTTDVTLNLTPITISSLVTGENAIHVANALDDAVLFNRTDVTYTITPSGYSASPSPQLPKVLASLYPFIDDSVTMTNALNQLHPAQLKGMAISQQNNAVQVRETVSQRMQQELDLTNCFLNGCCEETPDRTCGRDKKLMTVWLNGIGETLGQKNVNNSWGPLTGYRTNTGGIVGGIDAHFFDYFYVGTLGAYTHSHLHWKNDKGTGDISSGYFGLYSSFLGEVFYGNLSVIGAWSSYSANRHIKYGSVDLTAKNKHGGSQIIAHADTGFNLDYWQLTFRPFDSFDYIGQSEGGYQEYNAGQWDLNVKSNSASMIRNELGIQFARCYSWIDTKWTITPKVSWIREVRMSGDGFDVRFADGDYTFFIEGYFPNRNLLGTGLNLSALTMDDALSFELYYNGAFGNKYANNDFGGQIRYGF